MVYFFTKQWLGDELMAKKVAITSDSGCDLFPELYKQYNVGIIPLYINMENKSLRDGIEVNPPDIFASVSRTKKIPKTAAPSPADFEALFRPYIEDGFEVVHISMNSVFSCSYQNADLAAQEFEGVYVIDSKTLSTAQGLLVIRAVEMAREGNSAKEIYDYISSIRHKPFTHFVLDTLEYAYRGGRCSRLTLFGSNLLKLRACLAVDAEGIISVCKKFRGNFPQVALAYADYMMSQPDIDYSRVFISYTSLADAVLHSVIARIKREKKFKEILITKTGCTVSCHGGPNTLAIFYMKK